MAGQTESTENLTVINRAIAERARALDLTPRALAEALHVRAQTVYKWLSGEITPPVTRWRALERALKFPAGHFARIAGLLGDNGDQAEDRCPSVLAAIDEDPTLSPMHRRALAALYLSLSSGAES